jgi:hypothetical protein
MEEKVIFNLEFQGGDEILNEIVRIREETAKLKTDKETLTKAAKEGSLEEKKALEIIEIQIKENNKEVAALTRQYGAQAKEVKNSSGSLVEMRKELRQMVAVYDSLSKEQRENSKEGLAMKQAVADLTKELKAAEGATERHQRNVGNYEQAFSTAGKSIREMQLELRELKKISQEGMSPDQIFKLEQAMGQLRDATEDANARIKVQAMDDLPALVASLQGVVAATQLVVGTMSFFGIEDERVKKLNETMVQLIGVSQALATVQQLVATGEAKALAVKLKTIAVNTVLAVKMALITAAQWAWNVAMTANPIGAIIVGIAALIAGIVLLILNFKRVLGAIKDAFEWMMFWKKSTDESKEATDKLEASTRAYTESQQKLNKELERTVRNTNDVIKAREFELKLLKAMGANSDVMIVKERELLELKLQSAEAAYNAAIANGRATGQEIENINELIDSMKVARQELILFDASAQTRDQERLKSAREARRKEEEEREKSILDAAIREEKAALKLAVVNAKTREEELQARTEQIRRLAEMELENKDLTESEKLLIQAEAFNAEQELMNAHHEYLLQQEQLLADERLRIAEEEKKEQDRLRAERIEADKQALELQRELTDARIEIADNLFETIKTIAGKESALARAAKAIQKGIALVEIGINLQRELAAIRVAAAVQDAAVPGSGTIAGQIKSVRALTQAAVAAASVLALNSGGVVPGVKTGRDTVPAMLTPGEGVIREQAMSANDHYSLSGTPKQIASYLNQRYGGVAFHNRGGIVGAGTASGAVRNVRNELNQEKLIEAFANITIVTTVEDINNGVRNDAVRNQIANY